MPIQSVTLCDTITASATIPETDQFIHGDFTGVFACIVRAGSTPLVQAILHIVPHPFGTERFGISLLRMDGDRQWNAVPEFRCDPLDAPHAPMPYFRRVELELPLSIAGDYMIRVSSSVDSFESTDFVYRFGAMAPSRENG